jgi:hypothetical protein
MVMKTANCITCSTPFDYEPHILCGREYFAPTDCPNCIEEHQGTHERIAGQIEEQRRADDLRRAWERICPAIYRDTDVNRLTPTMRKDAETWISEDGRGLAFVGATGKCKTRVCYMILARYHFDGYGVFGITSAKLAALYQNKFLNRQRSPGRVGREAQAY